MGCNYLSMPIYTWLVHAHPVIHIHVLFQTDQDFQFCFSVERPSRRIETIEWQCKDIVLCVWEFLRGGNFHKIVLH